MRMEGRLAVKGGLAMGGSSTPSHLGSGGGKLG